MGRQYERPPFREAVCHFLFDPKGPWDDAIPGLVYERLDEEFPLRRQATDTRLLLSDTPPGPRTVERVRFFGKEETTCVQLGPHFLAVNQLPPYPSWEAYLPLVERAVAAYREVAEPTGLTGAEIRYLNHVRVPPADLTVSTYFNIYPALSEDFPEDVLAFITGAKFLLEESNNGILRVEVKSAVRDEESIVILDVYVRAAEAAKVQLDALAEWLNGAHDAVEFGFEASLTDELRETFR